MRQRRQRRQRRGIAALAGQRRESFVYLLRQAATLDVAHHIKRHGVRRIPLLVKGVQRVEIDRRARLFGRVVRQQRRPLQAVAPQHILGIGGPCRDRIGSAQGGADHLLVNGHFARRRRQPVKRFFQQLRTVVGQAKVVLGKVVGNDSGRQRMLRIHGLLPQCALLVGVERGVVHHRQTRQQAAEAGLLGGLYQRAGIHHHTQFNAIAGTLRRCQQLPA